VIFFALAAALAWQAPGPPSFHATTRLVQVNVIVRDKNGPVADLSKDDFTITDRGKARPAATFAVSAATKTTASGPLPPNTYSNRYTGPAGAPGSVTIVLLDALNTLYYGSSFVDTAGAKHFDDQAIAYAKQQILKFARNLDAKDRVAIYALGTSLHALCDFTSDPAELQKVLNEYRGEGVTRAEVADPAPSGFSSPMYDVDPSFDAHNDSAAATLAAQANGSRAGMTLAALLAIANHAAAIPGRKNLIWVTADPPLAGEALGRLLSRANLAIYPVDARGLVTSFTPRYQPAGQDTLRQFADATGGRAFVNNNDLATAVRSAVDDGNVSYTLGFYVDDEALDGKFHELKIRVNRPGLEVRYPDGYFATRDETDAGARQRAMRSALASPFNSAAIHILARLDKADRVYRLSGSLDLHDVRMEEAAGKHTGAVEVLVYQQDALGRVLGQSRQRLNLSLTDAEFAAYLKSGVMFRENFEAKPGVRSVRILAGDPGSAVMGSLIIQVSERD
jgi:VWFA-related protein